MSWNGHQDGAGAVGVMEGRVSEFGKISLGESGIGMVWVIG